MKILPKSFFPIFANLLLVSSAFAHEFWLRPDRFTVSPNSPVNFTLNVGMNFSGELRPFSADRTQALHHYSAQGAEDWLGRVPPKPGAPALTTTFPAAGTHMVAYDSQPSTLTLPAVEFNEYLHEDGLAHIAAAREKSGTADRPGRERYRRCIKTLLRVGTATDSTFAIHTGQRIEFIPLDDPLTAAPGSTIRFQLLFDRQPLAHTLVRVWHRDGAQLKTFSARTDTDGNVAFTLPLAGPWLVSTVHMIPVTDDPALDWDSFWCTLTFELAAR